MRNTMLLWIQLILRSARILSLNTARKHLNRSTTALLLLVMTPRLCPTDMLDTDMASVMLTLRLSLDIPLDLSAMPRRTGSVTRSQSRTLARSQGLYACHMRSRSLMRSVATLMSMLNNIPMDLYMDMDTNFEVMNKHKNTSFKYVQK